MNQSAIAYTFITITFILLVIVVVYHTLRYTRLYNFPFVHKLFMKLSSKLNGKEETENDVPEELDGHQPERTVETTVTRTIIELQEPLLKT